MYSLKTNAFILQNIRELSSNRLNGDCLTLRTREDYSVNLIVIVVSSLALDVVMRHTDDHEVLS